MDHAGTCYGCRIGYPGFSRVEQIRLQQLVFARKPEIILRCYPSCLYNHARWLPRDNIEPLRVKSVPKMTGLERRDSFLEPDSSVIDTHGHPIEPDTVTKDAEITTPQVNEDEDIEPTASMTYVTILATPTSTPDTSAPTSPFLPSNPPQPTLTLLCNSSPAPATLPSALLAQNSRLFRTLSQDATHPLIATPNCPLHLNIDHEAFTVFARWLRGAKIHVPFGDENCFATDLYLRAHMPLARR